MNQGFPYNLAVLRVAESSGNCPAVFVSLSTLAVGRCGRATRASCGTQRPADTQVRRSKADETVVKSLMRRRDPSP